MLHRRCKRRTRGLTRRLAAPDCRAPDWFRLPLRGADRHEAFSPPSGGVGGGRGGGSAAGASGTAAGGAAVGAGGLAGAATGAAAGASEGFSAGVSGGFSAGFSAGVASEVDAVDLADDVPVVLEAVIRSVQSRAPGVALLATAAHSRFSIMTPW